MGSKHKDKNYMIWNGAYSHVLLQATSKGRKHQFTTTKEEITHQRLLLRAIEAIQDNNIKGLYGKVPYHLIDSTNILNLTSKWLDRIHLKSKVLINSHKRRTIIQDMPHRLTRHHKMLNKVQQIKSAEVHLGHSLQALLEKVLRLNLTVIHQGRSINTRDQGPKAILLQGRRLLLRLTIVD